MTNFRRFRGFRILAKPVFALCIGLTGLGAVGAVWFSASPSVHAQSSDTGAANAATAMPQDSSDKMSWGTDFEKWPLVTGDLFSRGHGSRLAVIRATPWPAAQIRVRNAEMLRHLKPDAILPYPVGTVICMQTWDVNDDFKRGAPGPIFFMKKEPAGYDPEGGDWRYAMARPDLTVLADGKDGHATACRTCHQTMKDRDFVPAIDR